jgi:hypothetical protein
VSADINNFYKIIWKVPLILFSFPFSAKKLAEELEGWLGASGLSQSPDVRGVIAP